MRHINTWFSLVEILMGILIVSIVMLAGFQALTSIWIGKVKLIEKTKIEKEAFFATEKLFEMIKEGWVIDYEEYWNRDSYDTTFANGHYANRSGFWNFWDNRWSVWNTSYGRNPYHCLSKNGDNMWTDGCLMVEYNVRYGWWWADEDKDGQQRYTQYLRQFIDRNSDNDTDGWDENGDGSIVNDADDFYIGIWPDAFVWTTDPNRVWELYFISADGDERTYFRWNVGTDPDAPASATICDFTNPEEPTWESCLGTLEFLKLVGRDYGYDHNSATQDTNGSQWDGIIDTWLIHSDFTSDASTPVAASTATQYWQKIFPDTMNISDVEFYLYPSKSLEHSWRDTDSSIQMSPYLQIKYTIEPSWKEKKKIRWNSPAVHINSTVSLSDLDFR